MSASKQARTLTHFHNAVPLVWGSLRLAPINAIAVHVEHCGGEPRPRALGEVWISMVKGNAGLLPECSVGNCSGDSSSLTPMVPYFLSVIAPTDRPSTADYSQMGWRSLQVRVVHKRHS